MIPFEWSLQKIRKSLEWNSIPEPVNHTQAAWQWHSNVSISFPLQQPSDKKDSSSLPLSLWPALDVHLENFRLVIPDSSYTNTFLLSTSSLHITSALDFTSPDVRFVTDPSTFGKLARLSQEKQLPPLPLYQLDLIGVGLDALVRKDWYVVCFEHKEFCDWFFVPFCGCSVRSFLCTSTADLRVVYTPPLCLTPPTQRKEVVQATGHCLELNVITDATLFVGYDQVRFSYIHACLCM